MFQEQATVSRREHRWRHPLATLREAWRRRAEDRAERVFFPEVDVRETRHGWIVRMDLPGIDPRDVDVVLSGGVLRVSGEREQQREASSDRVYLRERAFGSYAHSFRLPAGADAENLSVTLEDGVLEIVVPRSADTQARRIEVRSA